MACLNIGRRLRLRGCVLLVAPLWTGCSLVLGLEDKQPYPEDASSRGSEDASSDRVVDGAPKSDQNVVDRSVDGPSTEPASEAGVAPEAAAPFEDAGAAEEPAVVEQPDASGPPEAAALDDAGDTGVVPGDEFTVQSDPDGGPLPICQGGTFRCEANLLSRCTDDGTAWEARQTCGDIQREGFPTANTICNDRDGRCDECTAGSAASCGTEHSRVTCNEGSWMVADSRSAEFCTGSGLWVACLRDTDCPNPTNLCLVRSCVQGHCDTTPNPAKPSCNSGAGAGVCDGTKAGKCIVCQTGQKECQGSTLRTCNSDHTDWTVDPCDPNKGCDTVNLVCRGCVSGASRCDNDDTLSTCDGQNWNATTVTGQHCYWDGSAAHWVDCVKDANCPDVSGICVEKACKSDHSCGQRDSLEATFCPDGVHHCNGSGGCAMCSSGDHQCSGTTLQNCKADRTGFEPGLNCGAMVGGPSPGANLCTADGCLTCTPNGSWCKADTLHKTLQTCNNGALSESASSNPAKPYCSNASWVQCLDASQCDQPTHPCQQATCIGNVCGVSNRPAGTVCAGNGTCGKDTAGNPNGQCNGPGSRNSCPTGAPTCQGVSCCTDILVQGGWYKMGMGSDTGQDACPTSYTCNNQAYETPEHRARVNDFYLDEFEVTVGRFREFWRKYGAASGSVPPPDGKGGTSGIPNSGWQTAWNTNLVAKADLSAALIACSPQRSATPTWVASPTGDSETRAINCVTWYEAFAFCIWDGGRLPTEAEWEFAAAAGGANRLYPWGSADIDSTPWRLNYIGTANTAAKTVGSYPTGVGAFGHLDLAGGMGEWVLDFYSESWYTTADCDNCANLNPSATYARSYRGGGWDLPRPYQRAAGRNFYVQNYRGHSVGFRCVREHN